MSTTTENLERNHRPRWNIASSTWFLFMIGSWIALGAVAVSNSHMLTDFWRWGQRLPLVAEIGLWIGTLPWMLAIAVLETSWTEWLQIALIVGLAVSWVLFSIPRSTEDRAAAPSWNSGSVLRSETQPYDHGHEPAST